jgi:actin-related protein
MVLETIAKCDVDIRKELYGGVVLTGGTALLTGVSSSTFLA